MTEKKEAPRDAFEVVNELARDSAGVTYLAEQRSTGRRVAVKLLTVDPQTVRSQFRPTVLLALLIPLAAFSFWLGTLNRAKPDVIEISVRPADPDLALEAELAAASAVSNRPETMPEEMVREALQPEAAKLSKLTQIPLTGTQVNFFAQPAPAPESFNLAEVDAEPQKKAVAPATVDPAFFAAAKDGDTAELKRLLDAGIPIDAEDLTGNTALMTAVFNRRTEAVRFLLTRHPDLAHRNHFGQAAADLAAGTPELENLLREAAGEEKRHAEHP